MRIDAADAIAPALEATDIELSIRRMLGEGVSAQQPGPAVVSAKALAKVVEATQGRR